MIPGGLIRALDKLFRAQERDNGDPFCGDWTTEPALTCRGCRFLVDWLCKEAGR